MNPGNIHIHIVGLTWLATIVTVCAETRDWRHDLLESSGIASDHASIRAAIIARKQPGAGFETAYANLGSESYRIREEAQAEFLAGGTNAHDWLAGQPVPEDPEVRHRRHIIMRTLASSPHTMREGMLFHAKRTLLDEKKRAPGSGGVFYEWFGSPAADCKKGYRLMRYDGPENGELAQVKDGRLILRGDRPGQADQRLILQSSDWPGTPTLPEHLTVRTLLGGTAGGGGTWHVAVSIGDVKTLFHPGYQGGGFRHETVGTHDRISQNTDMGFTPGAEQMFDMTLELDRAGPDRYSLKTVVLGNDGQRFEDKTLIEKARFGRIESIAVERSGRSGGNALFEQLSITLGTE